MPPNAEEKEKCLEKLNEMQKYLPFIDFMIDKIKKKNSKLSLECQLSKFQVLKSMIAEKSGKYSWDVIVKVEEIIEKLIAKLDFKDECDKSKEWLGSSGKKTCTVSVPSAISEVASAGTATVTKSSSSQKSATQVSKKGQELPMSTVDLIMKTFKVSVGDSTQEGTEKGKELSKSRGPNLSLGISGPAMETDVNKDLDGLDLTDCSHLSDWEWSNSELEPVCAAPEKASSHGDLLSSSREKLLKSLQSRLAPNKTDPPGPKPSSADKTEKRVGAESLSAFSRYKSGFTERKSSSDFSENISTGRNRNGRKSSAVVGSKGAGKASTTHKSSKCFVSADKSRCDVGSSSGDANLKQRLKEKFSTDICEVYRVPGRSVGGSLRSLSLTAKTPRKSLTAEQEELLRSDKVAEMRMRDGTAFQSKSFTGKKDGQTWKWHREKTDKRVSQRQGSTNEEKGGKGEKKQDTRSWKSDESKCAKESKNESQRANLELSKLNDDELLDFVKENMEFLPHLAKLKPEDLRRAVQSSGVGNPPDSEVDSLREKTGEGFLGSEVCTNSKWRSASQSKPRQEFTSPVKNKQLHPLHSIRVAEVGTDGVAKNVKPMMEPSKDVDLAEIGDKTHDLSDTSNGFDLDEGDGAQKRMEEAGGVVPEKNKVKKGLLELPLPISEDLFDDIFSIESFETLNTPNEARDPRRRVSEEDRRERNLSKSNSENSFLPSADTCRRGGEALSGRTNPHPAKDNGSRFQNSFGPQDASTDSYIAQWNRINRPDAWPSKSCQPVHGASEVTQHSAQISSRSSNESSDCSVRTSGTHPRPPPGPSYSNSRYHSYGSAEPKTYAEYKRMKLKVHESSPREIVKGNFPDNCEMSRTPAEREEALGGGGSKKPVDHRLSKSRDSYSKQSNTQNCQFSYSYDERRRSLHSGRRFSEHSDHRSKVEEVGRESDRSGKIGEEKRHSLDSEELVSPLEELYRDQSKPKTGRGYGIQNFKIPKKARESGFQGSGSASAPVYEAKSHVSHAQRDCDVAKESFAQLGEVEGEAGRAKEVGQRVNNSGGARDPNLPARDAKKVDFGRTLTKSDTSIIETSSRSREVRDASEAQVHACQWSSSESKARASPDIAESNDDSERDKDKNAAKKTAVETLKKCEAQVAECDSSVSEQVAGNELVSSEDKCAELRKEENNKFSQEFVETLIRKSFESGEGKLLLAHAKLFEEIVRKLNKKKLETIRRVINSETESSSCSGETVSEDERTKKKSRKWAERSQRSRKGKKRGRKRQRKLSSSCSSSESNETSEEEKDGKKYEKKGAKESESSARKDEADEVEPKDEAGGPAMGNPRSKRGRKHMESDKHFSGRKVKRKERQEEPLEEMKHETPQMEEEKPKERRRRRGKTELDRLHDDIRNMFLKCGEVTPTGQRMCRTLKQSGGNINNVDIVKESAKTVEEEKVKTARGRSGGKSSRGSQMDSSDSKSQSADGTRKAQAKHEYEADPKLASEPRVVLQRVDLNYFGYGVRISESCISFKRLHGQNMAIRSGGSRGMQGGRDGEGEGGLVGRVFLGRNMRKVERLNGKKWKRRGLMGRKLKLADVVRKLRRSAGGKMDLKVCDEEVGAGPVKKESSSSRKSSKRQKQKIKMESKRAELLNYAFERAKVMYPCKLCSHVTRHITGHYKAAHPQDEVLISRLCVGEAKKAKWDAKKNAYEDYPSDKSPLLPSLSWMRAKVKAALTFSGLYSCRMCSSVKTSNLEVFKAHVSSHTGEFRFQCPAEGCSMQMYAHEDLKIHILTKHPKNRMEYCKVNEVYSISVVGKIMFGFLCSICNYVQLNPNNVTDHILRQHAASENASIIRINMSRNTRKPVKKKSNVIRREVKGIASIQKGGVADGEKAGETNPEERAPTEEANGKRKRKKRKLNLEGTAAEAGAPNSEKEFVIVARAGEVVPVEGEEDVGKVTVSRSDASEEKESNVSRAQHGDAGGPCSDVDTGDCADLNGISSLKGSEISSSSESSKKLARANPEKAEDHQKFKLGPQEDSLLEESEVLYECYIKGCMFCTRAFDVFERHVKVCHCRTKRNGKCEICTCGRDNRPKPSEESSRGGVTAPRNLTSHEREKTGDGKMPSVSLMGDLKLCPSREECVVEASEVCVVEASEVCVVEASEECVLEASEECVLEAGEECVLEASEECVLEASEECVLEASEECVVGANEECVDEDGERNSVEMEEAGHSSGVNEEEASEMEKTENAETAFPPKPLLRVRSLLGDRLSTPKESFEENEVIAITDESSTAEAPQNSMFTIENVRSLNDAPLEDAEIQIQNVCSLKGSSPPLQQLAPGKTILVRSCPTRKIAIRPEPNTLSIDVGQLSVVQSPTATHPVVLAPLATASPIRIISSSLASKTKFNVKPILVSPDPAKVTSSGVLSLITPVVKNPTTAAETKSVTRATATTANTNPVTKVSTTKPLLDVMLITPPSKAVPSGKTVPPSKAVPPSKTALSSKAASGKSASPSQAAFSTGSLNADDREEKESVTLQRIHHSPNVGNKRVKDAKIYEEMLTKTKLCHLFKCMGIECSFTCNNECVFRQHIGLHDAQRRLKSSKGMRTIFLRLANKTTRAFYWQQCAYCCELLTNTNNALSQHVLEEHGHCMYQCAFCFYRAVSHSYVEIHQNLAHSQILKTTPRVIYKCKPLRNPPAQNTALEKHGRRQSVRPYHCDQCGRKFFITQDFVKHLTTQHQSVTAYTCHICKNLCFKADRLIVHYKLHSYCTYQCAYCLHGTETEKEMVFHLCNFHFSQPAVMYVRAVADGQSHDVNQKQMTKKKHVNNQLDSLKVIVYESDTLNADCIVEVDPDEEMPENASEEAKDLSAIVAELGINTETQGSGCVTPLMKELASIGDKNTKNLTVKTLLPNAQFSSEMESGTENFSILISSGLSAPSDQSSEKAMNIPLGQLPLEVVNVQRNEAPTPPHSKPLAPPDKNLKLNEILVNLQSKEKSLAPSKSEEGKQPSTAVVASAIHKLPPVVLSRSSAFKNVYPSKSAIMKKKSEGASQGNPEGSDSQSGSKRIDENKGGSERWKDNMKKSRKAEESRESRRSPCRKVSGEGDVESDAPRENCSGVGSSVSELEREENVRDESPPFFISEVCSLTSAGESDSTGMMTSIQSNIKSPTVLEPPIIRVEDFNKRGESEDSVTKENSINNEREKEKEDDGAKSQTEVVRASSPDVIIVEKQKSKNIITVTLDSDDEKNEKSNIEKVKKDTENEMKDMEDGDDKIRKEMELLRKQIASETDSLLFDEDEGKNEGENGGKNEGENGGKNEGENGGKNDGENGGKNEGENGGKNEGENGGKNEGGNRGKNEREKNRKRERKKKGDSGGVGMEGEGDVRGEKEEQEGKEDLTLRIEPPPEESTVQSLLSPIEEAICSLNKKLQSETEEAQRKKQESEGGSVENSVNSASEVGTGPRTRLSARGGRREREETRGGTEGNGKRAKKGSGKKKMMKEGLKGKDLFICGNEGCSFAAEDDFTLRDHVYVCELSRETCALVCPHCGKQSKQFHLYLEHVKYHGEKKFHCGLCDFSSAVDGGISRHMKQKHKCSQWNAVPKGSEAGHLIYYPKNHKLANVSHGLNIYLPGEEDKLPLQSVYLEKVSCGRCPYFTKVRSNMYRHLRIHLKAEMTKGAVVVPSTAPTNPVPCWERKERMFDKMTNLAASSQLAQAKEKSAMERLSAEDEAKLPQHVPEQMRYKCCLPDCNYITVDDGMLKHHIKALHDEINYYSCPHCPNTVHVDMRHVTLDKIGHHLKHHDMKLYKCAHCIYFHYQKNVVEKHALEKHPERRYFVHTVREPKPEPKPEVMSEEEGFSNEGTTTVWKCGLCDGFRSPSKPSLMDHLLKNHNIKSRYRCQLCSVNGNNYQLFYSHFASKHPKEKMSITTVYSSEKVRTGTLESGNSSGPDSSSEHFDTTPLWQRGTSRVRHIRGILIEEEELKTKRSKRTSVDESETETSACASVQEDAYMCPLCTNKKKPFFTRSEEYFRTHLYQELNYQQFACILCGKMFVNKKDFEKHHARVHPGKTPAMKQTTEDHEIQFWVDQVIEKRQKQMEDRKRKLSDEEASESQAPAKKKKEV